MPSDGERSEDELAVTATAPGHKEPAPALGATLGRYRLERELGAGGMGVVHAAFDPDLERRVALKVLRTTDVGGEARQRLLREARALARLTHPNVVTVHEVGSASGRDFVAMELIEGETLADWLRSAPRSPDEILGAYIAAGRGLAAAHAAGLVHRDFKPHNVLRRKDGRIVVTDFGLARGVEMAVELEATLRLRDGKVDDNTPSPLTGLTQTGSVLGTPAYMAPEQWSGGTIGPAADQFAFCVALWEALAGERPYRGDTLDALKEEVHRGPAQLDASKLPRRVRAPLLRGLDPDPKKRWPSMDALLAAIGRPERKRRGIALMLASGAVVASAIGYAVVTHEDESSVAQCEVPALDAATVWSPAVRGHVAPELAGLFDTHIGKWKAVRAQACSTPSATRARRLPCLDGVLARLDAVRKSTAHAKATIDDVSSQLIDPSVCAVADPPRLPTKLSEAAVDGFELAHHREPAEKLPDSAFTAALAKAKDDACARSLIHLARAHSNDGPEARDAAEEAVQAADACGDDRTRAEALLEQVGSDITFWMPKVPKLLATAESAIQKVSEPELVARLLLTKAAIAEIGGQFDEQRKLAEAALALYGETRPRGRLRAALTKIRALLNRRNPGDFEASRVEIARWRKEAERMSATRVLTALDVQDSLALWSLGDIEAAHARYPDLRKRLEAQRTEPPAEGETISGMVVDRAGKPVAGATVAANTALIADSISIEVPFSENHHYATTDAGGRFTLEHVPLQSIIVAQLGAARSHVRPAKTGDKLVLEPTTKVAGRVTERGDQFAFAISGEKNASSMYQMIAPIRPDGTFELKGVPVGKLRVGSFARAGLGAQSIAMQNLTVGADGASNIEIKPRTTRKLSVVVRSAAQVPLTGANVFVAAGTVVIKSVKDLERVLQSHGVAVEQARSLTGDAPQELRLKAGDLVATFTTAPSGAATACALGFTGELTDKFFETLEQHRDEVEVRCTPVAADAKVVTVEVPPMKRFD